MVDVETLAPGQEPVVRRRVVIGASLVGTQEQATVGNVGVVFIMGKLNTDPLVITHGATVLDDRVGHVVALVHEAVAFRRADHGTEQAVTGRRRTTQLNRRLVGFMGTGTRLHGNAVSRLLAAVVDHATNGARAIAQRRRTLEHLNAVNVLHTR